MVRSVDAVRPQGEEVRVAARCKRACELARIVAWSSRLVEMDTPAIWGGDRPSLGSTGCWSGSLCRGTKRVVVVGGCVRQGLLHWQDRREVVDQAKFECVADTAAALDGKWVLSFAQGAVC